eukprot:gnl/Hemi2/13180_TR4510_c0_g1_i1.p1 gnl/Hemi2/13180_TR4510_c0_g1~~gnl/Hemi2/13180_TR4510_c0_g1_i1.p1  ORF type:complete len:193 (-),score=41.11 gnl/Hemi2/13180_TR4510_c0_g1_i1:60-590(-)
MDHGDAAASLSLVPGSDARTRPHPLASLITPFNRNDTKTKDKQAPTVLEVDTSEGEDDDDEEKGGDGDGSEGSDLDDKGLAERLQHLRQQQRQHQQQAQIRFAQSVQQRPTEPPTLPVICRVEMIYDFETDEGVALPAGAKLCVVEKLDEDGWWRGVRDDYSKVVTFPSNFVMPCT